MAIRENYLKARYLFFRWRYSLAFVKKVALAFGMACVTGLVAQIRIPLPWSPVPITGQVFVVLLSGVILGKWWGGISQTIYAGLGVAGIPWFAGLKGGLGVLIGPTGGYIMGFILASVFMGYFTDKYIRARSFRNMIMLMAFANFVLIYSLGLLQLAVWFYMVEGTRVTIWRLLLMGAIPFIIGDIIKIFLASASAKAILPKEAYNGEVDA